MLIPLKRAALPLLILVGAAVAAYLSRSSLSAQRHKNESFPYRKLIKMEDLIVLGKELMSQHPDLNSFTFALLTPEELPAEVITPERIPHGVRYVIVATVVENGVPTKIIHVELCAALEESVAATLPLTIER